MLAASTARAGGSAVGQRVQLRRIDGVDGLMRIETKHRATDQLGRALAPPARRCCSRTSRATETRPPDAARACARALTPAPCRGARAARCRGSRRCAARARAPVRARARATAHRGSPRARDRSSSTRGRSRPSRGRECRSGRPPTTSGHNRKQVPYRSRKPSWPRRTAASVRRPPRRARTPRGGNPPRRASGTPAGRPRRAARRRAASCPARGAARARAARWRGRAAG